MSTMEGMEELLLRLAEEVDGRRYGKYRGVVENNEDPEGRGRLRLVVPSVLGETVSAWALPCLPFGGKNQQGLFFVPEQNSHVWVEFEEGDIDRPIWTGVYWQKAAEGEEPETEREQAPVRRILRTPGGHVLEFDDSPNEEKVTLHHKAGAELTIDEQGSVHIEDASGNFLTLDASKNEVVLCDAQRNSLTMSSTGVRFEDTNGSSVETSARGISLNTGNQLVLNAGQILLGGEGGESVALGNQSVTEFTMHRHTTAPILGGPSSPPLPGGQLSRLSTKVRTT